MNMSETRDVIGRKGDGRNSFCIEKEKKFTSDLYIPWKYSTGQQHRLKKISQNDIRNFIGSKIKEFIDKRTNIFMYEDDFI